MHCIYTTKLLKILLFTSIRELTVSIVLSSVLLSEFQDHGKHLLVMSSDNGGTGSEDKYDRWSDIKNFHGNSKRQVDGRHLTDLILEIQHVPSEIVRCEWSFGTQFSGIAPRT